MQAKRTITTQVVDVPQLINEWTRHHQVKDQRVEVWQDAALGMCVKCTDKRKGKAAAAAGSSAAAAQGRGQAGEAGPSGAGGGVGGRAAQFVLTLSLSDWEIMKAVVQAADCKMKHRWVARGTRLAAANLCLLLWFVSVCSSAHLCWLVNHTLNSKS